MDVVYRRQEELLSTEQLTFPVSIVGAGGIGSPTALALAKLGCERIVVYDPDRVEPHNLPNQLYGPSDLGRYKVDALGDIIERLTGARLGRSANRVLVADFSGVVILAVDTMSTRSAIWSSSIRLRPQVELLVDARMGGEVGRILAVNPTDPDDIAVYEASLHDDDTATADACLVQAVGYSTLAIAGLVASIIRKHAIGVRPPVETFVDLTTVTLLSRLRRGGALG